MSQTITKSRDSSNEPSWGQFGVEEDLQKWNATTLFILAASFCIFWPVLRDWAFDRANELQMEKFKMFWKVDSTIFPTHYPMPNVDTNKAAKRDLKVVLCVSSLHCALLSGNFCISPLVKRAAPRALCTFLGHILVEWPLPLDSEDHLHSIKPRF